MCSKREIIHRVEHAERDLLLPRLKLPQRLTMEITRATRSWRRRTLPRMTAGVAKTREVESDSGRCRCLTLGVTRDHGETLRLRLEKSEKCAAQSRPGANGRPTRQPL